MSETRTIDDATAEIKIVTGPQPREQRAAARIADAARDMFTILTDKPLTDAQRAKISQDAMLGHTVGKIVDDLLSGKTLLESEKGPPAVGTAKVVTPDQVRMGIVKGTGRDLRSDELRDLASGKRTPPQIVGSAETGVVVPHVRTSRGGRHVVPRHTQPVRGRQAG